MNRRGKLRGRVMLHSVYIKSLMMVGWVTMAGGVLAAPAQSGPSPKGKINGKAVAAPKSSKKAGREGADTSSARLNTAMNEVAIYIPESEVVAARRLGLDRWIDEFNRDSQGMRVRLTSNPAEATAEWVGRNEPGRTSGTYKPLFQVLDESRIKMDSRSFPTALRGNVIDDKGRLLAFPIGGGVPALFYNKAALVKAGLNPEDTPVTWLDVQKMADKLQDAGYACPYTSSWVSWVHVDNVSTRHVSPIRSESGGYAYNSLVQVKHIAMLSGWSKANFFKYFGPHDQADGEFLSGQCAMITTSSDFSAVLARQSELEWAAAPLPYYDDAYGVQQGYVVATSPSLWLRPGHSVSDYRAAARFLSYLNRPDLREGFYPAALLARGRSSARGTLVSYDSGAREALDKELQGVWKGERTAKEALDSAVNQANSARSSTLRPSKSLKLSKLEAM